MHRIEHPYCRDVSSREYCRPYRSICRSKEE